MAENARNTKDYSKTTVGSTSTELLEKGSWKKNWRAMAPRGADLWINPAGGPAGPDLPGSFLAPAGTMFGSSSDYVENTAINYWCASAGLTIPVIVQF